MNGKEKKESVDWLDKPYYSLNAYFKHVYGQKIYKIAVDAGLSCPNRDGHLDTAGCTFCSAGGSGDFAVSVLQSEKPYEHRAKDAATTYHREYDRSRNGVHLALHKQASGCHRLQPVARERKVLEVKRQIERGLARFHKSVGERFVIYFQAYTNTYGEPDYLRAIWEAALLEESVVGISIGTRPDCLGQEILDVLKDLKSLYPDKFVWVELGLQTMHNETAERINRHYPRAVYETAVEQLSNLAIPYITHVILGLPGETEEMMLETVRYVCNMPEGKRPQGIKLQLLHVLRGTAMEQEYEAGLFSTLEQDVYIDLVIKCLRNIPSDIVVHRVTGDGPKSILISPLWSGNKKVVLNQLHKCMAEQGALQGDIC